MAFNNEDQGDYITACYFYNKVIEIAISAKVFINLTIAQTIWIGGSSRTRQMLWSIKWQR